MCDQQSTGETPSMDELIDNDNFKSLYARSVVVNSQYRNNFAEKSQIREKCEDNFSCDGGGTKEFQDNSNLAQESPVRFRKNRSNNSMDDSRRYSCGSILSRRSSLVTPPKRNEIPVENIYNQKKIEGLQWQLREIERSRGMYKDLMKQIVIFLEKAHVSLGHLGHRLNRKTSVPRSKSEHHVDTPTTQKALIEEHLTSWTPNKKPELHPEEVPPEKLSQEAFRLLRTAQSLLNTQEPTLTTSENHIPEELSDLEFLAQVAKEFPSEGRSFQSFSLSPKLILPEQDLKIQQVFNRKLSLQLSEVRRTSKASIAETECYSLPPGGEKEPHEYLDNRTKEKAPRSPATASISSTEDESGFSSMNSFQDVGLPLVNSTGIDEVSARSVLLKSMIHNNDYGPLGNDSDTYCSLPDNTLTSSPFTSRRSVKRGNSIRSNVALTEDPKRHNLSDVKLWQKPSPIEEGRKSSPEDSFQGSQHARWHSNPDPKSGSPSLKVLWV